MPLSPPPFSFDVPNVVRRSNVVLSHANTSAKDFLVQLGGPADKLKTISYGKERPVCTESNEECWQRNRRAHFSTGQ